MSADLLAILYTRFAYGRTYRRHSRQEPPTLESMRYSFYYGNFYDCLSEVFYALALTQNYKQALSFIEKYRNKIQSYPNHHPQLPYEGNQKPNERLRDYLVKKLNEIELLVIAESKYTK